MPSDTKKWDSCSRCGHERAAHSADDMEPGCSYDGCDCEYFRESAKAIQFPAADERAANIANMRALNWLTERGLQNRKVNYLSPDKCDLGLADQPTVAELLTQYLDSNSGATEN